MYNNIYAQNYPPVVVSLIVSIPIGKIYTIVLDHRVKLRVHGKFPNGNSKTLAIAMIYVMCN